MKLQLANSEIMDLPILLIDSMTITSTGVLITSKGENYCIGASYITGLHITWSQSLLWIGITSESEAKSLWSDLNMWLERQKKPNRE